jgi:hypothetical protein
VCVAFPRQKPQVLLFHKSEPQVPRARGPDDATQRHSRSERNAAHQRVAISIASSAQLQRPLLQTMLKIVASGEREDPHSQAAQSQPSLPL